MKTISRFSLGVFLLSVLHLNAQTEYVLPNDLNEISGLEIIDDSTLVALNDGGHKAELFVLGNEGQLKKRVKVIGAKNKDWEDLASDGVYLYIGDIGNNMNKRSDLCIYKVLISDVVEQEEVTAEKISYDYEEQVDFPPSKAELNYDAEALICVDNTLWIITKPNAQPWDGIAAIYKVPTAPGNYVVASSQQIEIGKDGWYSDAVTGADVYNESLYLTTYNRIIQLNIKNLDKKPVNIIGHSKPSQIESIVVRADGTILIADEKSTFLGGGKLYYIRSERD